MTIEPKSTSETDEAAMRPTYVPIALAMAIMMLAWGLLTHWTVSLFGAALMTWALTRWMKEICREWRIRDES